jgi:hypothetical protein
MGSNIVFNYYFWPIKKIICFYHEEQCQIGYVKTIWFQPTYQTLEDFFLITNFWTWKS